MDKEKTNNIRRTGASAKTLRDRYTWINREFDMDVPGLREAKLRYHPEHCAKAWYIKKKEITP